ncbi:MBL fold metallo-hydrolase [bacterium]|nr:MBL fold metallo-hydrolase [bacterium]
MTDTRNFGQIRFIQGEKRGRYPYCHTIYIEKAGVLIDPSADRNYLEQLKKEKQVNSVWLTHWHEDHLMHLDLFSEVPLWMHEKDAPPLSDIDIFIDWYGLEMEEHENLVANWRALLKNTFHFQPRVPERHLQDGDVVDLNGLTVEVIHCPGHSPGSLAFFFREPEILFLGDTDLTPFGPWYGDRYSNIEKIIHSVNRLKEIPAKIWLTSHEQGIFEENPGDLWGTYLNVIQTREDKLIDFLAVPRTLDEIATAWIIYGKPKEPIADFKMMEQISMKKHADRLIEKGIVVLEDGRYRVK